MSKQTEQSTPTAPPAYFALPYSGDKVPAALEEITVKITGEMNGHEGVAFNAEVRRGRKVIGIIENQGNGGGTWFRNHTYEDLMFWNERVKEMKRILVEVDHDEYGDAFAEEMLADRLYENVALYRDLNRKRNPIVRVGGDNDRILTFSGGGWDDNLTAQLKARAAKERKTYEKWVKNQGWETL